MRPQVQLSAHSAKLASACADLERRLTAGEDFRSEQVFEADPDLILDTEVAIEVIYTEYVTRDQLGQRPSPTDFIARFPQFRTALEQLFEIHGAVGRNRDSIAEGFDSLGQAVGPGRRVGNYELLEEIGRGGMGIVYKARQVGLDRLVALKMILSGVDAGPRERARFRAEAEAAARLQHPGIVQVFQVGEHDGHPFLVFEYLAGGSLERYLSGKPWPPTEAARLVESIAAAVQHAHDHGIVHRDLKPANILLTGLRSQESGVSNASSVTPDSRCLTPDPWLLAPKVADFGLARQVAADQTTPRPGLTVTGTIIGTPAYMAPEQAVTGSPVGPAADVYSLGAILFELLTGRPPFQGLDVLDILDQLRSRDPVPPSRLLPSVPRDLETICLKCLRKDPRQRYASAAELAADLGRFLRGEPIRARPTPAWERAWKWANRNPAVARLVALVAIVLVAGATTATVLWRQTAAALVTVREERNEKEVALATTLIALAHRDWFAGDLDIARNRLNDCPPAYRDAQWRYLERACNARLHVLEQPRRGEVRHLAWSSDSRCLAATHVENKVHVWDASATRGTCVLNLGGLNPGTPKFKFAAFADDHRLVTVSTRSNAAARAPGAKARPPSLELVVNQWDATNGQSVSEFSAPWPTNDVFMSGDGRRAVEHFRGKLTRLEVSSEPNSVNTSTLPIDFSNVRAQKAVSHDGRLFAGVLARQVHIWDTLAGAPAGPPIDVPIGSTHCLMFDPDATHLAVGSYQPERAQSHISVREVRTGREVVSISAHTQIIECMAFTADGSRLATGSADKTAMLWDARTGRELLTMRGMNAPVTAVAFSPDGTRLAVGCRDGGIHIWDARMPEGQ
jgi:serine/threonine protein kinase